MIKIRWFILLCTSHAGIFAMGFALGVYTLPLLIAPPSPSEAQINEATTRATYTAKFTKDLKGSDALHWGEGTISMGEGYAAFIGELAPGPDYQLYLSPEFVETEEHFEQLKSTMLNVGDVKTFNNFVVEFDTDIDLARFNTLVVWCESFGEFITSAKYR